MVERLHNKSTQAHYIMCNEKTICPSLDKRWNEGGWMEKTFCQADQRKAIY